jgi:DNA-binding NtrC family response regulator
VGIAGNGEQALEHYRAALADSDPYRVVLLDINLPGMKGQECLKRILDMDDTARVIITSGDRVGMQDPDLTPVAGILPKPFRLRTLVYSVASALDSPMSNGLAYPMASTA